MPQSWNFNIAIVVFPDRTGRGSVGIRRLRRGGAVLIWGRRRDVSVCSYSRLSDLAKTKTTPFHAPKLHVTAQILRDNTHQRKQAVSTG